jgi:hypothetical protein
LARSFFEDDPAKHDTKTEYKEGRCPHPVSFIHPSASIYLAFIISPVIDPVTKNRKSTTTTTNARTSSFLDLKLDRNTLWIKLLRDTGEDNHPKG